GPEVRVLKRARVMVNLRVSMGVAHTNTLAPQITRFRFPSANNTFAASFGGSVDYRITDRLSYRIVQPELLLTRSGSMGENWNQYNFRLSTGVVFTCGRTPFGHSSWPPVSSGVAGDAAWPDAF